MEDEKKYYKTKENSIIYFEWVTVKNNFQSETQGRPIFDKVLRGIIMSPGQQKSQVNIDIIRIGTDNELKYLSAYPKYKEFVDDFLKDGDGGKIQGTPIEKWNEINLQRAAELRAMKIFTVETLAELPDSALQNIGMDSRTLQKKARNFLNEAKNSVINVKKIEEMQKINDELNERIKKLEILLEKVHNVNNNDECEIAGDESNNEYPENTENKVTDSKDAQIAPKKRGRKKRVENDSVKHSAGSL